MDLFIVDTSVNEVGNQTNYSFSYHEAKSSVLYVAVTKEWLEDILELNELWIKFNDDFTGVPGKEM